MPLRGVRVLAFETAYSLPAGTRTLAELGAEVVRCPSPSRGFGSYISVVDGVFLSKPCVCIDLKTEEGRDLARRLAVEADAVCSNFTPPVMRGFGLAPEDLLRLKPGLVVLQLSGYGAPGPWADFPAFGPSTEAAGGMNYLMGRDTDPPVRVGSGVFADQLSGRYAALALVAALEHRRRTGEGQYMDLSMAECVTNLLGPQMLAAATGRAPRRLGNRDEAFAPQGIYRCRGEDEWVAISVKSDDQWQAVVDLIGDQGLKGEGLATAEARRGCHREVDAALSAWTATKDKHDVAALLQARGIAAGPVRKVHEPMFDEHLTARGLFQMIPHEAPLLGYGAHPHPTTPWVAEGRRRARLVDIRVNGADNAPVLRRWLGMSNSDVRRLTERGVLVRGDGLVMNERVAPGAPRETDFAVRLGLPSATQAKPPRRRAKRRDSSRPPRNQDRPTIRVLEVAGGPAAAFAAMLLADVGAEVIRVEPARAGETYQVEVSAGLDEAGLAYVNRRKRSVTLDLRTRRGAALFVDLARGCDAVIEDLGPGRLEGLGLNYARLKRAQPLLALLRLSSFGRDGPRADWHASELVLQAMGGVVYSTGWDGEAPLRLAGLPAHFIAGIHAATATLAATYGSGAGTERGVQVDVSAEEAFLHHWTRHIAQWAYSGVGMRREPRTQGRQGFPHTVMAADGWLYILALNAEWEPLAFFLGLEPFITHEWSEPAVRSRRWPEIEPHFYASIASRSKYDWFAAAAERGYTFAPIESPADVLAGSQAAARGFLKPVEAGGRSPPAPGMPFSYRGPERAPNRPPRRGEHSEAVLRDVLGLTAPAIADLRKRGIV